MFISGTAKSSPRLFGSSVLSVRSRRAMQRVRWLVEVESRSCSHRRWTYSSLKLSLVSRAVEIFFLPDSSVVSTLPNFVDRNSPGVRLSRCRGDVEVYFSIWRNGTSVFFTTFCHDVFQRERPG